MAFNTILRLRPAAEHDDEHKVGWLELFYDLVYVATVIALGNRLADHVTWEGVATFAILFVPLWWSWTGMAFYITRFHVDDIGHRLLVFAQMFALGVLAIYAEDGLGDTSQGFALGYVAARMILVLQYLRVDRADAARRALATRYAQGFTVAAMFWLVSAFVPEPARFALWAVGMIIDFGTPLLPSTRRLQAAAPPSTHHLPERFGLFTIIVLGEAFIKVISGADALDLQAINGLLGALAMVVAASLWWMYFDHIQDSVVTRTRFAGQVWVYTHLPLVASITAFGVAAKKVVLLDPDKGLHLEYRLLFVGSLAVALLSLAVLELASSRSARELARNRLAATYSGSAVLILLLGLLGSTLPAFLMTLLVSLIFVAQLIPEVLRYMRDSGSQSAHTEPAHEPSAPLADS